MKSRNMDILIRLEELGFLVLTVYLFSQLPYPWWLYPLLLFLPDISILGYMANEVVGAYIYNFLHHRGIAVLFYVGGLLTVNPLLALIGLILFAHSSLDRLLGMGLRHRKGFKETHLGPLGKKE